MIKPDFPKNEAQRQKALERYAILDTIEEESYDNLTALLASICEVPISLVSLLDKERNFMKSHYGVPFNEDPRERSFCGHTIMQNEGVLIVADATLDERFHDNPLVTEMGVRFYAGASLVDSQGFRLGALCVFGREPKILTDRQKNALANLSKHVMLLLESRLLNINLLQAEQELQTRNEELEKFAAATSHDLKSPLHNIVGLLDLLKDSSREKLSEEELSYIDMTKDSARSLSDYISGLLKFYQNDQLISEEQTTIKACILSKELASMFSNPKYSLKFYSSSELIRLNAEAFRQILMNLISNGFKCNDSEAPTVSVSITENKTHYCLEVKDNGVGIPKEDQQKVFDLFETSDTGEHSGPKGTGIGLATVKKLVEKLEGVIEITSIPGKGSKFTCLIPKHG
ncbi:GAF domain-containing sensor histidine kinase [Cryomorphaceae bacterium 1068]|nr:GAF domain-containing sensor histidine kinase [Cryomorphaceae bacterium 1068]